ncbi:MAG: hypothetical protein JWM36_209 [Hyphomicrobiales bacterium]|jgi:hypothetical protein|nr:hypothetical protein [Hyphomicrobiales bacterium]
MSEDDGTLDVAEGRDYADEAYSDFVAERANAFGRLALMLDCMKDDHAKELTRTMLKAIIRSIRTPPEADLVEWPRV